MPGRTFASVSKQLLVSLSFREVHELPNWAEYVNGGRPILPAYKQEIKKQLQDQSVAKWKASLMARTVMPIHIQAQQFPVSVGAVFLEHDIVEALGDAEDFGKLQLGRFVYRGMRSDIQQKGCVLCGGPEHGLAHILAACCETRAERNEFLWVVDAGWRCSLLASPHGDWPTAVLSPHQGVQRLRHAARFAARVVKKLYDHGAAA